MKPNLYLETSVISYLAAYPSSDLVVAARQQITREWWARRRRDFDLYVSELVIREISVGDPQAVARRLGILDGLAVVDIISLAEELAAQIIRYAGLPVRAGADALHIALAASHGMHYLMTWNVSHIANARIRPRVEQACRIAGYEPPVLCTPDELLAGDEYDG